MKHSIFSRSLCVTTLALLVTACGSIKKHHRLGSVGSSQTKLPGSTFTRLALRSTALAVAKDPWNAAKVGTRMLYERTYSLVGGSVPGTRMKMSQEARSLPRIGTEEFEALLDKEGLPARSQGSVKFYVNGPKFYPAYFKAIEGAKKGIDVQAYIFDNDHFGLETADRLKRKSKQVPVRVYYDHLGSLLAYKEPPPIDPPPGFKPPGNLKSYLTQDSNVKVRGTSNPFFVADHTKLHVIDGQIAFVGGMNVGVEYRFTWHDLMARIEGPIVSELAHVYRTHWQGEEMSRRWGLRGWFDKKPEPSVPATGWSEGKQVPLRMLLTDTPLGKRDVLKAALASIRCARQRVWIQTPYISSDEVTREMAAAAKRGVDVRIIVPAANDSKLMEKANVAELKKLLETGTKVYEYPGMTHLKATICDDWGMFGSANYDTLSMRINRELNIAISDPSTVRELVQKVFQPDFRISSQLTLDQAKKRGGLFTEVLGDQL